MNLGSGRFYEFGPFRIDTAKRVLLKNGKVVQLTPKAFDLLLVLARNKGELVEKSELIRELWPNTFVEEANLSVNMSALRKALGEKANEHLYIATAPGRGYRFVAEVVAVPDELPAGGNHALPASVDKGMRDPGVSVRNPSARSAEAPESRRRMLFAVMLILAVGTSALYLWTGAGHAARPPEKKSIAILPFKVIGTDAADEYLGLALTDVLIARLSSVGQITIRPTSAVQRYLSLERDPVSVGRELNVESVVEGTVQKTDNRVRLTIHLVAASSGELVCRTQSCL